MTDKQTLQKQIDDLKKVLSSPKTQGATKNLLTVGLKKAEAKMEELNKATKLEKSDKELTPKQENNIEQTKKETSSLAKSLKEKVAKAKQIIAKTTPTPTTKKGGSRSVAKAKEKAKERRSTQKKQSLKDSDIEKDAVRYAISKVKRKSQGGRANQYGTKAENKGGTYYERRENRYDVQNKRYAKLEDGGMTFTYELKVQHDYPYKNIANRWLQDNPKDSLKYKLAILIMREKKDPDEILGIKDDSQYARLLRSLEKAKGESKYEMLWRQNNYSLSEAEKWTRDSLRDMFYVHSDTTKMADGGYNDFGYHVINDEVTLKNGKKVFVSKGRYYSSNELSDGRISGVYYESKDMGRLISADEIMFPLNKMADGGMFDSRDVSRDRMFKSQQGWEQDYQRKTRPRNPHYNKLEDGGGIDLLSDTSGAGLQNVGGTSFSNVDLTPHLDITNPMFAKGGGTFNGQEFRDILGEAVTHLYKAENRLEVAVNYLRIHGQQGIIPSFIKQYKLEELKLIAKNLDEASEKKKFNDGGNVNQGTRFMSSSGMKYANGGGIPNNYRGRTTEDIWNSLTENQRVHFMIDHFDELGVKENQIVAMANKEFKDLNEDVQNAFGTHKMMGQYADGGMMNNGGEVNKYSKIFDELKKGDKIKISFSSGIKQSNEKDLLVLSKNIVGKGKSFESEKITFKNLENPNGVRYYAYKRKSGFVSFAMGDLAISNVEISFADEMRRGGDIEVVEGDKIKSKVVNGKVYYASGTMFKLEDEYGNKNPKYFSTRDFKKSEIIKMAKGGVIPNEINELYQFLKQTYPNTKIILNKHKLQGDYMIKVYDEGFFSGYVVELEDKFPTLKIKRIIKTYNKQGHKTDSIIVRVENKMAKGGMVVTSIKDIPNFKEKLDEGKITYRGLGMGKLYNDFYEKAGESGTRIKVDGKEYFITDTEFDTFSRGSDGKMRIKFDAPQRKGYAKGGTTTSNNKAKSIAKNILKKKS